MPRRRAPPVADAASRSGLGSGAERCERVVTRDVSATRRNRMSPWKRTKQKATRFGWLFVWCCFPQGKLFVSRGADSRFACGSRSSRRDSRPNRPSAGRSVLTASSGSAPNKKPPDLGGFFVLCCFPHGKLIVSRGAASPFALRAPVQLAGTLGLTDLPPEGRS